MVGFQLDWAFNNAEFSDAKVILTTEQPEACRTRLLGLRDQSRHQQAGDAADDCAAQVAGTAASPAGHASHSHATEELYAHKVILCSNSAFFAALFRWGEPGKDQAAGADNSLPQSTAGQLAIVSLPDPELFATAKLMIQFMYTQKLEPNIERPEMLQLLKLGDEYSIPTLRAACLQQLNKAPLHKWEAAEKQLLCSMAGALSADSAGTGWLAKGAAAAIKGLVAAFLHLEEVWRRLDMRRGFCSLPHSLVLQVLSSHALVVRSENTALVAALSWLRTGGKGASLEERREVLQAVRLLQLSPWFTAWVVLNIPETPELLPPLLMSNLVRHLASPASDKGALLEVDETLKAWMAPRKGASHASVMELEMAMEAAALEAAVRTCREVGSHTSLDGDEGFFNGAFWKGQITVAKDNATKVVRVWVGAMAQLVVGDAVEEDNEGIPEYPSDYMLGVGETQLAVKAAGAASAGTGRGHYVVQVGEGEDLKEALMPYLTAGRMVVKFKLLR
jgi:hypothetical protein